MKNSRRFSSLLIVLTALFLAPVTTLAADPGERLPDESAISDQKAGSVLFYNIYTSVAANTSAENTRINITNTSAFDSVSVKLYLVDGSLCSPADNTICLTPNQTASFTAAELDPGTSGYVVAVATDANGCPIKYNFLIGDLYVKFASGHAANLGAEAVSGLNVPPCSEAESSYTLNFDGSAYGRLPSVVAVDNIASRLDGNNTLLILNRPSGDLMIGADKIGAVSGLLYDDKETPFSFSITSNQCQVKFSFGETIPRTAPRFNTVVPAGRTGWVRLNTTSNTPLLGAAINRNEAASTAPGAFNQGHNLHKLKLTNASVIVPVFPANCS